MKTTKDLADYLCTISYYSLPADTLTAAECAVIDHIGAGLYGSQQESARVVADHAISEAGSGTVPVYGRARPVQPGPAARANGTASSISGLDDLHEHASLHAGSVIIPAALAAAIERDKSGCELLEAVVVGYEAVGRIAVASRAQTGPFHITATHGVFGSAAAVARLAGLNAGEIVDVFGIAGSFASGLKAFQTGGGEIKWLHPGRSAESGMTAVALHELGLTGPHDVLENERGFLAAFGGPNASVEDLDVEQSQEYVVDSTYFKPYASGSLTHPAINAVRALMATRQIDPKRVGAVIVGTSRRGLQQSIPSPTDTMSLHYSMESAVALTLLGQQSDPRAFTLDSYASGDAPNLAALVTVVVDEEAQSAYPKRMAARVTIDMADGSSYQAYESGLGSCEEADVRRAKTDEKFLALTRGLLSSDGQQKLLAAAHSLSSGACAAELLELAGPASLAAAR